VGGRVGRRFFQEDEDEFGFEDILQVWSSPNWLLSSVVGWVVQV
jgi:hypothetical protein